MANITLDHIKTIVQSIIASVTRYKPNLSVTDPDDPRYVVGVTIMDKRISKAQDTADKAIRQNKDLDDLLNGAVYESVTTAQSAADAAKTAAGNAQSTANAAKTAASNAQSTADAASSMAKSVQTTANAAKSAADTAKATADAIKAAGTDWNQNDSTALDFIKNRTHYSLPTQTIKCGAGVVTEQISQSVAGSGSSSTGMYALKTDAPLPTAEDIIGARVTINNVTYTITSEDILKNSSTVYACKYLPNKDWTQAAGIVAFFVNVEKYMTSATFPSGLNNASTVVTLPARGVYFQTYGTTIEYGGGVVPLDEKYLPASVTSITLKSATSGSSKRFRLTVDDTGTIKAEEVTT